MQSAIASLDCKFSSRLVDELRPYGILNADLVSSPFLSMNYDVGMRNLRYIDVAFATSEIVASGVSNSVESIYLSVRCQPIALGTGERKSKCKQR